MSDDRTKLGRPATGLPRYYMDVGWYRHPRFLGLPLDVLFVFEASVAYCYEHGLSGVVPGNAEDLAVALGLRAAAVRKAVPRLLEREAFHRQGDQIIIRSYADHNPTGEEVQRRSAERSSAGSWGNHKRWHVDRGISVPEECDHCVGSHSESHLRVANGSQTESHGMGWDGS